MIRRIIKRIASAIIEEWEHYKLRVWLKSRAVRWSK